jgi:ferrous iron transport protein B
MPEPLHLVLAGNPNTGKTTLFNAITGMSQKTGNFPGTTVEKKSGNVTLKSGAELKITDLPGFYSMYPKGEDESVSVETILTNIQHKQFDKIVLVADASNLKRCLLLCTQLVDLELPLMLVLNMLDIAEQKGIQIDTELLARKLQVPVLKVNARKGEGVAELLETVCKEFACPPTSYVPSDLEEKSLADAVQKVTGIKNHYANTLLSRHPSLLSGGRASMQMLTSGLKFDPQKHQVNDSMERYARIKEILNTVQKVETKSFGKEISTRIDQILTHKVYGYLIFLFVFFSLFQAIFTLAEYPMGWIESLFGNLSSLTLEYLPQGTVANILANGIIPGLGGVIVFLPQIMILFAFLTVLEDTGYMARVSFILDRMMKKLGLNGKSVVPLIGGMACAVASIISARNIENKKEKLITILVTPFMSCSARLPVYTVLISLIVEDRYLWGFINVQGLLLLAMYLLGIMASLLFSLLLTQLIRQTEKNYFIMELPVYKWPVWGNVYYSMYNKSKDFVGEAGKVIVAVSILLWFLGSYAPGDRFEQIEAKYETITSETAEFEMASEKLEASYAGIFGKFIEPAIQPLGYDWKIGVALISSLAAREVFVGTMSTLYSIGNEADEKTLKEKLQSAQNPHTGLPVYTTAVAFSLMIFYAFSLQCISTIAVTKRETGGWKWAIIQFVFMTAVAYLCSFVTYQLLK